MSVETPVSKENQPMFGVMTASRLPAGSHLVLQGMRLWKTALIDKRCVFATLHPEFSDRRCAGAIRYIDEPMCLLFLAARRQPTIATLYRNKLSNDEFRILNAIRCVVRTTLKARPINSLISSVDAQLQHDSNMRDIIRVLRSEQLGFQLPVRDGGRIMKRINYTSRAKVMRSIVWISGCTIFFVCYAFSWTLVI